MLRCSGGTAGRSHIALCVGFKVAALMALSSAVAAITSANCAYMRPVKPGRNAAGRNTDISTSVMPMIGPSSWRMAALAASRPDMPFSMLWTAPSTTTIASFTTMPIASTIANRVEKLTVNPSAAMAANAPMMVTGTVVAGISIAPVLQEHQDDDEHEDGGLVQRFVHLVDRLLDEFGGVEGDVGDQPLRELALEHGQFVTHFVRHVERVRTWRLVDRQPRRRLAVEGEDLPIGLRSELDPAHVAEPRDLAGATGLDDHLREFGRVAEPAGDVEGILERLAARRGRRADLARGDLRALLPQRLNYVLWHQPARLHFVRIEPNAHRILTGAEHDNIAHAGEPRDFVLELDGRVIGEVEAVVARVGRRQRDDLQDRRRILLYDDALRLHRLRQRGQRGRYPVLHQHLRKTSRS